MKYDYTKSDITKALIQGGISYGNNIFIHSNIGFFGKLNDTKTQEDYYSIFKDAIFSVIGNEGTLVVPTFSYSFCWNQIYDPENTPSYNCGIFSELTRNDSESIRSEDPNFSITAIGKNAEYFTKNPSMYSYGMNSFWQRFMKHNGIFCCFNTKLALSFIHYVEKTLNISYRYDKIFEGKIITKNGELETKSFYHYVYDYDKPFNAPNINKFDKKVKELGLARAVNLGKGQIVTLSAKNAFNLIEKEIKTDKNFLINGE